MLIINTVRFAYCKAFSELILCLIKITICVFLYINLLADHEEQSFLFNEVLEKDRFEAIEERDSDHCKQLSRYYIWFLFNNRYQHQGESREAIILDQDFVLSDCLSWNRSKDPFFIDSCSVTTTRKNMIIFNLKLPHAVRSLTLRIRN